MSLINFDKLNCNGCPAKHLQDIKRAKEVENMREKALEALKVSSPRLIILCESAPAERFVYDLKSKYESSGLRANLRNELVPGKNDYALFEFMNTRGIWIVDCALCPLCELGKNKKPRRLAATICLKRHTISYLKEMRDAELVAIFPSKCGFLKRELPSIATRIKGHFNFSDLEGLRELVNQIVPATANKSSPAAPTA